MPHPHLRRIAPSSPRMVANRSQPAWACSIVSRRAGCATSVAWQHVSLPDETAQTTAEPGLGFVSGTAWVTQLSRPDVATVRALAPLAANLMIRCGPFDVPAAVTASVPTLEQETSDESQALRDFLAEHPFHGMGSAPGRLDTARARRRHCGGRPARGPAGYGQRRGAQAHPRHLHSSPIRRLAAADAGCLATSRGLLHRPRRRQHRDARLDERARPRRCTGAGRPARRTARGTGRRPLPPAHRACQPRAGGRHLDQRHGTS